MKSMKIINKSKGVVLADRARLADTFWTRMVGLLDRAALEKGEALVITRCQSIHMFFMRFPIDAVFVDKSNRVVGIVTAIQPCRLSTIFFRSSYCIELPAGQSADFQVAINDQIECIPPLKA